MTESRQGEIDRVFAHLKRVMYKQFCPEPKKKAAGRSHQAAAFKGIPTARGTE